MCGRVEAIFHISPTITAVVIKGIQGTLYPKRFHQHLKKNKAACEGQEWRMNDAIANITVCYRPVSPPVYSRYSAEMNFLRKFEEPVNQMWRNWKDPLYLLTNFRNPRILILLHEGTKSVKFDPRLQFLFNPDPPHKAWKRHRPTTHHCSRKGKFNFKETPRCEPKSWKVENKLEWKRSAQTCALKKESEWQVCQNNKNVQTNIQNKMQQSIGPQKAVVRPATPIYSF